LAVMLAECWATESWKAAQKSRLNDA